MPARNNNADKSETLHSAAFTLIELILVMAIMATVLALIAPTLTRSFKQRGLDQEAVRMLGLTEYARNEAVAQGIPMQVWIDPTKGNFGAEEMPGYDGDKVSSGPGTTQSGSGGAARAKTFSLPPALHFDSVKSTTRTAEGYVQVIQFDPDGTPTSGTGVDTIRIENQDNDAALLTLTTDGWGYEITKEDANGTRTR